MLAKLLILMQLTASGADAYYTNRNAQRPYFKERDAIARPFVTHSTAELAGYFAVDAGVKIGVTRLLYRHHHRLAVVFGAAGIADSAGCAAYSSQAVRIRR